MTLAATDVSCYQAGLEDADAATSGRRRCPNGAPNNLWYRFIVTDGADTDYYADNTAALDGGLGAHDRRPGRQQLRADGPRARASTSPAWAQRRRDLPDLPRPLPQRPHDNDPQDRRRPLRRPGAQAAVGHAARGLLPQLRRRQRPTARGASTRRRRPAARPRSSRAAATTWAATSRASTRSSTTSRRWASTRSTSTRSSTPARTTATTRRTTTKIDPYFGTQKDWDNLVKHADERGIRIILDGVFNHLSSDSPFFDRYHHYPTVGACESIDLAVPRLVHASTTSRRARARASAAPAAELRDLRRLVRLRLHPGAEQGEPAASRTTSSPTRTASRAHWLDGGRRPAGGWTSRATPRSPTGYWETFREVVKATRSRRAARSARRGRRTARCCACCAATGSTRP